MRAQTLAGELRRRALDGDGGDALAIRFTEAAGAGAAADVEWSARDVWLAAERVGAGLAARGARPGDRYLVLAPDVRHAVAAHLGAWAIGATPIQLGLPFRLGDPAAFVVELERTAARLGARGLLVSPSTAAFVRADERVLPIAPLLDEALAAPLADPDTLPAPPHVQLTSGSTGHPRAVVIPHDRLVRHLEAIAHALPAGPDASGVTWLPLHHDMGLIGGLLYPLFTRFPVRVLSPRVFQTAPFTWLAALSEARATHTAAPPSAYAVAARFAGRAQREGLRFDHLRCAMIGAEPIAPSLLRELADAFAPCGFRAAAWFPVYGLAEATVAVTFPPVLAPPVVRRVARAELERGVAARAADGEPAVELTGVGRPLRDTALRIVDPDGAALPDGRVGEIHVRSATMMEGYDGEPDATREALADGWLRTGDLGFVDDGTLFVTGRRKDVIIRGGHNVYPEPIEATTSSVDGVRPGCVVAVGLRDEARHTEEIVVVAETRLAEAQHRELGLRVREALRLAGITVDRVLIVAAGWLPRTTSGKHRRRDVAARLAGSSSP